MFKILLPESFLKSRSLNTLPLCSVIYIGCLFLSLFIIKFSFQPLNAFMILLPIICLNCYYSPPHSLRSSDLKLLTVPRFRLSSMGGISAMAPKLWNSLPNSSRHLYYILIQIKTKSIFSQSIFSLPLSSVLLCLVTVCICTVYCICMYACRYVFMLLMPCLLHYIPVQRPWAWERCFINKAHYYYSYLCYYSLY